MPIYWIQIALILGFVLVWAIVGELVLHTRRCRDNPTASQTPPSRTIGPFHRSDSLG